MSKGSRKGSVLKRKDYLYDNSVFVDSHWTEQKKYEKNTKTELPIITIIEINPLLKTVKRLL